jgi:hypothetical protein
VKTFADEATVYELLRSFRHDLLNDLQLLSGHLQLNRSRDVLKADVDNMVGRIQIVSHIFGCRDNRLATLLWKWLLAAQQAEINISFDCQPLQKPVEEEALLTLDHWFGLLLSDVASRPAESQFLHISMSSLPACIILRYPSLPDDSPSWQQAQQNNYLVKKTNPSACECQVIL